MESKKELFGAMSLAQTELKNPVRNKLGFNYSYSTLDSIIEQTKPILAKYGLVVIQLLSGDGTKVGITTILAHSSGESVQETLWLPSVEMKSTNAVQAMGASISYGRRYSLTSVLGISSEEDTDASDTEKVEEDETQPKNSPPTKNGWKKAPDFSKNGTQGSEYIPSNQYGLTLKPVIVDTPTPEQVVAVTTNPPVVPTVQTPAVMPPTAPVVPPVQSNPVTTPVAPKTRFAAPQRPTFPKPNFAKHIANLNGGK